MINLKHIAFKGYKSFKETAVLEDIGNVNLIIGKNNSGKSSVLDILEIIFEKNNKATQLPDEIILTQTLTYDVIEASFRKNTYGIFDFWTNHSDYEYGIKFIDNDLSYKVLGGNGCELVNNLDNNRAINNFEQAAQILHSKLPISHVRKLNAERNIIPEEQNGTAMYPDGTGATSIISTYLNDNNKDESLIENELLYHFNLILGEDAHFDAIKVQHINGLEDTFIWEIFLYENGTRYALSQMGSGLKTILLVLLNLLVCPREKKSKIFLFEELENNLHPALQRRLFNFIYKFAIKNDLIIFLTTHSHVAINCFFEKESANIYHIEKVDGKSSIKKIKDYFSKAELLDDLDVRASDLLQSNGIIWVEGPSDRAYIKRWLSLVDSTIKENEHFQFVYYGGKLLSHYTANSNDEKDLLNVLLTNRHSAIVMDSDKLSAEEDINSTKKRVKDEFEQHGLFSWITQGKEIENYISCESLNAKYGTKLKQIGQYELFPNYINKQCENFTAQKVNFARELTDHIKAEHIDILDLKARIEKLVNIIKQWNHLS